MSTHIAQNFRHPLRSVHFLVHPYTLTSRRNPFAMMHASLLLSLLLLFVYFSLPFLLTPLIYLVAFCILVLV